MEEAKKQLEALVDTQKRIHTNSKKLLLDAALSWLEVALPFRVLVAQLVLAMLVPTSTSTLSITGRFAPCP
jgi:hypothetical protein